MKRTLLWVGFALFGLSACGSSSSAADFVSMLCDKYATCNMLVPPMSLIFGSTSAECQQKLKANPSSNPSPDQTKCPNTNVDACFSALKNQSCADLQAGTSPTECACK